MNELLTTGAHELGIDLTEEQLNQFSAFLVLLQEWNQRMNLTAIIDPTDIVVKHFLNALTLFSAETIEKGARVIDVGTGAGLPGIPLAIARADVSFTLIDALQKRIGFLEHVVRELGLRNVTAVHARAEELGHDTAHREQYDVAMARSVARLPVLAEYCLPFVKVGGRCIAYKAANTQEDASAALQTLGGKIRATHEVTIPHSNITHELIVIHKNAATPSNYPRRPGAPKKRPLL